MNLSKLNGLIIIILCLAMPISIFAAKATGKHALLIGIQDYDNTPFLSLKAPVRDIKLMEEVLRTRLHFQKQDFIKLLNTEATHTGIKTAFQQLAKRVRPGDFVYIHYSGHGSLSRDCNGDERSGKDQTWVPYGARSGQKPYHQDDYDILDDEINAWLEPIYAKTEQVVFVSDSCHSATVSRGNTLNIRSVVPDERIHFMCFDKNKSSPKSAVYRGINIGSARDQENAIEMIVKSKSGNHFYSLFTFEWAQALYKARVGDTWCDVFKRTSERIKTLRNGAQSPEIKSLQPQIKNCLRGDFLPLSRTVEVIEVRGHQVKIQAGLITNVTQDSVYRLYKPQSSNSSNLPRLTITQVDEFTSLGKAQGFFKKGDFVIEEKHVYPPTKLIQVYLQGDNSLQKRDKGLLRMIRSNFNRKKQFPAYVLTQNLHDAEQLLYLSRANPEKVPELQILTPEGRLLHNYLKIPFANSLSHSRKGMKLLKKTMNKLARIRELKLLGTDRHQVFPGNLYFVHARPISYCTPFSNPNCIADRQYNKYYRKIGEYSFKQSQENLLLFAKETVRKRDTLFFKLHNSSDKDYYFYLIEISSNGVIQTLFPYLESQKYTRIRAGSQQKNIPRLELGQKGETMLKLIATFQPIDVSLLEQGSFSRRSGIENNLNPLERLLLNAMEGRRGKVEEHLVFQWATEQVSFEVQ